MRNNSLSLHLLLAFVCTLCAIPALGQKPSAVSGKPRVINAIRHDVSPPLRDIPHVPVTPGPMREFDEDEHHVPQGAIRSTAVEDTAVQQTTQPLVAGPALRGGATATAHSMASKDRFR